MNVPSTPLGLPNPSLCCTQRRRSGPLALVRSLSLCLVEARPVVQVIFLVRFVCAALPGPFSGRVALGAVSWLFAVLAIYLANGVTDIVEDRHNGSTRPIASGALEVGFARQVIVASAALAMLGSVFVGLGFLTTLVLFLALGYAYSAPRFGWKRNTYGAATIALFGGLTTYLGGLLASGGHDVVEVGVFGMAMSCWMAVVGALAKDFSDVAGDRLARRRTAVIVLGARRAGLLVAGLALTVAVGLLAGAVFLAPELIPTGVITLAGASWIASSLAGGAPPDSRRPYRIYMFTQYTAHIAAAVVFATTFEPGGLS